MIYLSPSMKTSLPISSASVSSSDFSTSASSKYGLGTISKPCNGGSSSVANSIGIVFPSLSAYTTIDIGTPY